MYEPPINTLLFTHGNIFWAPNNQENSMIIYDYFPLKYGPHQDKTALLTRDMPMFNCACASLQHDVNPGFTFYGQSRP